ncbi:TIGR01457 family HAD-type hydrolase, partial [Escherichia coli]|nr:TIGR01457 family HAD-type hydrolase [Escherichia coli]
NNSTKTPDKVAEKLEAFGIPATEEQVFTTSQATANYLHERKATASAYEIGGEGIRHALLEKGFTIEEEDTDFVVVGLDQEITYEKLAKACLNVRNGAFF